MKIEIEVSQYYCTRKKYINNIISILAEVWQFQLRVLIHIIHIFFKPFFLRKKHGAYARKQYKITEKPVNLQNKNFIKF